MTSASPGGTPAGVAGNFSGVSPSAALAMSGLSDLAQAISNLPSDVANTLSNAADAIDYFNYQVVAFFGPAGLELGDPIKFIAATVGGVADLINIADGAAEGTTSLIAQNAANGRAFEQAVIDALGATKNTASITVEGLGTSIPDLFDANGNSIEIKSGVNISFTNQMQIQAQGTPGSLGLIVSPNCQCITGPMQNAVNASGGSIQIFNPNTGKFTLW